jgi:uncharacterized glyoxalase superfamily protein PhnB
MANPKARPQGYHSVTPSLLFDDAAAAIEFYKRAFGAQEQSRMPGPGGRIMHAVLKIGDSIIFVADALSNAGRSAKSLGGSPMSLHIYVENVDSHWKQAIAAGAKESMPLADQFWGDRYGKLMDPFGIEWSLGEHVRDVSQQDMERAAKQAAQQMQQQGMH